MSTYTARLPRNFQSLRGLVSKAPLGLWGGYGEYMEIFAGTKLHRLTDRLPAEQLTLFDVSEQPATATAEYPRPTAAFHATFQSDTLPANAP